MKNSNQFVNPHFDLIRLWLQENIGKFIVGLLIITYLATGFFIGLALQKGLTPFGIYVSWIAGMSIAIIGQLIRGSLVYFSQANPYRLGGNAHTFGTAAALLLTMWASYEVIHLLSAINVATAFRISIVGVVIAGFFVEVFFLNELQKINQAVLVNDPELYRQAVENEKKLAEIQIAAMEAKVNLVHARRNRLRQALDNRSTTSADSTPTPSDDGETKAPEGIESYSDGQAANGTRQISSVLFNAIGSAYKLDDEQMAIIRKEIDKGTPDDGLLYLIEGFSEKNRREDQPKNGMMDSFLAMMNGNSNGNGVKKP